MIDVNLSANDTLFASGWIWLEERVVRDHYRTEKDQAATGTKLLN